MWMRVLRWLAVVTTLGMLLVLVMGAAVTNTGSGEGCGRSWPLCHGQFIPEFTVAAAIEYSHRAVSGIEGLLVLALTVCMLGLWRHDRQVRILAPLMLGTLLLQAGLGAAAVMWPQSDAVLASHFGVSLLALASTFLSAVLVFEYTSRPSIAARQPARPASLRQSSAPAAMGQPRPSGYLRIGGASLPAHQPGAAALLRPVLAVGLYVLLVVYLGAYVRHADLSLACVDWPLCNGQLVPPLDGPTGVVFAHRLAALGAVILIGWLAVRARRLELMARVAWLALGLVVLQAVSGALVVTTQLGLWSTLAHAAIMALLFASLSWLVREVLLDAANDPSFEPRLRAVQTAQNAQNAQNA